MTGTTEDLYTPDDSGTADTPDGPQTLDDVATGRHPWAGGRGTSHLGGRS